MKRIKISMVLAIVFAVTTIAAAGAFAWAFMEKDYYQNQVNEIVDDATRDARDQQRAEDEADFDEREKEPNKQFIGPSDLGSVTFYYPKTWCAYNDQNDSNNYKTYFYKGIVPTIKAETAYALRVSVVNQSYDAVLKTYDSQVTKGELIATTINTAVDGHPGMRLDGQISKTLNGSVVLFKVRDKTLILQVDSQDFMSDFNNIVLASLTFSP